LTTNVGLAALLLCANGATAMAGLPVTATPVIDRMSWSTDSDGSHHFVAVHGHRSAIFGYSEAGLEAWVYPVQVLSAYSVAFHQEGASSNIDGQAVLRRIVYTPASVTRVYVGPDFIVRERLFAPLDTRGVIITYEVEGARHVDIQVSFVPALNLMWPASLGGQWIDWSGSASTFVMGEGSGKTSAIVESPDIVSHDDTSNATLSAIETRGLAFTLRPSQGTHQVHVLIAAGKTSADARHFADALLANQAMLEAEAVRHYAQLLDRAVQIETPDAEVNRALVWATVALDQSWVCLDELGCGTVAGYGPSRLGRRPQYDWFFTEDGMEAVRGMLATGQFEAAKEELRFIAKYRNPTTGMMWHEMSLSAPYVEWTGYPYMFAGISASFSFPVIVAQYVSATGDVEFAAEQWAALEGAFRYCRSLLNIGNSLPQIPEGKWGDTEDEPDRGDSLALANDWLGTAQAFAELAAKTGHQKAEATARVLAVKAAAALVTSYWSSTEHRWIGAHTRNGKASAQGELLPPSVLDRVRASDEQRAALLESLASASYQTDWGTRSRSLASASYNPNNYGGSVWALHTSQTATAFWSEHRPATALTIWQGLIPWSALDSLGHMHEVMAADFFHEQLQSVPEQTWSSAALLTSTVGGLLGLSIDASAHHLSIKPHIPLRWDTLRLRHLRVGKGRVAFEIHNGYDGIDLLLDNDGPTVKVTFDPQIPLGATHPTASVNGVPTEATLEANEQDSHARVEFLLPPGHSRLTLSFEGGVALVQEPVIPAVGDASSGTRFLHVGLSGRKMTVDLEGASKETYFLINTRWLIREAEGGRVESVMPDLYRIDVSDDESAVARGTYQPHHVELDFKE
jgi:glycogen debranching enzyme